MEVTPEADGEATREEVERLAEEFLDRRRRGEQASISEYASRHPEMAEEIREFFPTVLALEDLVSEPIAGAPLSALPLAREPPSTLEQLGEYRILRELGRGGMGVVYEAEQASLGRRVALKVLPFHYLVDSKHIERFHQEARAAARLSHPNIVPVYGVGEHQGMHYYVMQYIPGQGLDKVIREVRRLRQAGGTDAGDSDSSSSTSLAAGLESAGTRSRPERYHLNVARLVRDAAHALDHAHRQGVLHRDVKPSNLLLDPTGRVWLTDFGLAKAEGSDDITRSGDFVGTLRYMAPERFKGWMDPRSDVYGLGITLHELLTLRPAFEERDRARLLRKVTSEEPPAPRRIDDSIPRDLETIVLKSMSKEPGQRYATARAMADDLDRFLDGKPVEARRSTPMVRLGHWCSRNPMLATLVAAVILLLGAVSVISSGAAVRLARERDSRLEKLRAAYLSEAHAIRASRRPGGRFEALEALRQAAEIEPGSDLVDAALASFAQIDLEVARTWARGKDEAFTLSSDGSRVALAPSDGEISIRDAGDDRELFRLDGPGFLSTYSRVEFSPEDRYLAARYEQGGRREWRVWDLDRRLVTAEVKDAGATNCVGFSPDGSWMVADAAGNCLRLLDTATGAVMAEVGRGMFVQEAAIHPGGRLIAFSDGHTSRVHIYDREEEGIIRSLAGVGGREFMQVAWHPDGRTLAAASTDHLVYVWNAETGERLRLLQGHWAEAVGVEFLSTGDVLVSWGWDPAVRFWGAGSDRPIFTIPGRHGYLGGNRSFLSIELEKVVLWKLTPQPAAYTLFGHEGGVTKHPHSITLAPGGRLAATAGDDGVRLWDLAARAEICRLTDLHSRSVVFEGTGRSLYSSGFHGLYRWPLRFVGDGSAKVEVGPAERLTAFKNFHRLALGDEGRRIAIIHEASHVHVLDADDVDREVTLQEFMPLDSIALSPDGSLIAAASPRARQVLLRDARSGELLRKLEGARGRVSFDSTGTYLAAGTARGYALWRIGEENPVWRLEWDDGPTLQGSIAFDRGGRFAAVTRTDSKIWLIDVESGRKLCELDAVEPIQVTDIALESGMLVASTVARRIHVWDLTGLARDLEGLGLRWEVPASPRKDGGTMTRIRARVIEGSLDLLAGEAQDVGERELFRPLRDAFLGELASCAEIDRKLAAPKMAVSEGDSWRYFCGRSEPSPGLEWTLLDFDDRRWMEGRSPFIGRAGRVASDSTILLDQPSSYTTLYVRRVFDGVDPDAITRVIFAAEVEDGLVVYLNGREVGRTNAGGPAERLPFDALASRPDLGVLAMPLEIGPALLVPGRNVLAIQVLACDRRSHVRLLPVLALVPAADPSRDRNRTGGLLCGPDGAPDPFLFAYREARILQRAGRFPEALAEFERAHRIRPEAAEPHLRRLACLRALGEIARVESLSREAIERGEIIEDARIRRAWFQTALVELDRPPADALLALPREPRAAPARAAGDYRWLLGVLAARGALRIDCGGGDFEDGEGRRWSGDRFFVGGSSDPSLCRAGKESAVVGGATIYGTERIFPGNEYHAYRAGYLVPLPPGRYRVALHFCERMNRAPNGRIFSILLEGRTVLEGYEPLKAGFEEPEVRSFDLDVTDGALDLDFAVHQGVPGIAGIEIEPIGS